MARIPGPLADTEKARYNTLNPENLAFLMKRYNRVNRWVIADMIRRSAYHYPDKKALIFGDTTLTYAELEAAGNRVANALNGLGVKKYDRVAILAHNTIHHVLTWMGCCKIGAVYLAINYLLKGKDISYCINHSESTVFIVEDALYDLVKDVLDDMPTVRTWIWSGDMAGAAPADDRFIDFASWYAAAPDTEPDSILHIEDPCQMTYTSGTESLPKGVIISNQALMAQYMGCHRGRRIRCRRHQRQRPAHLPLRPAGRVLEPRVLGGRDQHPHDAGHRQDPENHRRLPGQHVLCSAHGLDRPVAPPRFRQTRPHEPSKMLLRRVHHAGGGFERNARTDSRAPGSTTITDRPN